MLNNLRHGCLIFCKTESVHVTIYRASIIIKCWQYLSCKIPRRVFALKNNLLIFPLLFQVDLEPEGKVFVVITLTGSFTEGKGIIFGLFTLRAGLWRALSPSVTKQYISEWHSSRGPCAVGCQRFLEQWGKSGRGRL